MDSQPTAHGFHHCRIKGRCPELSGLLLFQLKAIPHLEMSDIPYLDAKQFACSISSVDTQSEQAQVTPRVSQVFLDALDGSKITDWFDFNGRALLRVIEVFAVFSSAQLPSPAIKFQSQLMMKSWD